MTNEEMIYELQRTDDGVSAIKYQIALDFAINSIQENAKLKEAILDLQFLARRYDELDQLCYSINVESLDIAINSIQENAKLKAEIEQLKTESCELETQFNILMNKCNILEWNNSKFEITIAELKSELEQSVKLPYPINTPIYFAYSKQGVVKDRIRRWQINKNGLLFNSKGSAFLPEAIGKTIFLTREEAEQSLKGQV